MRANYAASKPHYANSIIQYAHTPLKKQRTKNHFYIKISETLVKLDFN